MTIKPINIDALYGHTATEYKDPVQSFVATYLSVGHEGQAIDLRATDGAREIFDSNGDGSLDGNEIMAMVGAAYADGDPALVQKAIAAQTALHKAGITPDKAFKYIERNPNIEIGHTNSISAGNLEVYPEVNMKTSNLHPKYTSDKNDFREVMNWARLPENEGLPVFLFGAEVTINDSQKAIRAADKVISSSKQTRTLAQEALESARSVMRKHQ